MMPRSYDIFLSHSGAHKYFVEILNAALARVCRHYSVFFDRDAIKHGEQISISILEYARTCKLAVVVVSDEYFTRSKPPMMELAASYTAAKAGKGFPCLLPVFFALHPEDAKDSSKQLGWQKMWQIWEVNDRMSERRKSRPRRVQPTVWKEAVDRLLDTRGPIYIPKEYGYDPEVFMKKVAQVIARRLDDLNGYIAQSKVGDQLPPLYEEVDTSEATGVEEDSSENSGMDSGLGFDSLPRSGSNWVAEKVTDEKEALPQPYSVVVSLEFGCTFSTFAYSHIANPDKIHIHWNYPGSGSCRTVTGIYYSSRDGGQSYQVESWGNPARSRYERGQRKAGRAKEDFLGIYVTKFNPHLKVRDRQISTSRKLKLPHRLLPVDRLIIDYLHQFGAYILHVLQGQYGVDLTMKMIQWCVPVPSSWDNAAQEEMKTCMESAGLINGADGSPYPVKMVGELEAASIDCLRCSNSRREVGDKLLVVDIGESFFEVVVQEVVSICKHIHRVKEMPSDLFTRHISPDTEFKRLLHRMLGPCLQKILTEYPAEYQYLLDQGDILKSRLGGSFCIGQRIEISFPKILTDILERYEQNACPVYIMPWIAEESDPRSDEDVHGEETLAYAQRPNMCTEKRVPGNEWASEVREGIEIQYREFQSLLEPVIEELLSCISSKHTEVGGVRSLVLLGDRLAESPYVLDNIRQRFSSQVPEIIGPRNFYTAKCQGVVALAQDLCNDTSSTS